MILFLFLSPILISSDAVKATAKDDISEENLLGHMKYLTLFHTHLNRVNDNPYCLLIIIGIALLFLRQQTPRQVLLAVSSISYRSIKTSRADSGRK